LIGHIFARVKLGSPLKAGFMEAEAVVDTGATLTVIPSRLAEELGLEPTGEAVVNTGAGLPKLPRSRAWVEVEGKSEVIPVLVSDVIDRVLIGVTALEILGLKAEGVDPPTLLGRALLRVNNRQLFLEGPRMLNREGKQWDEKLSH